MAEESGRETKSRAGGSGAGRLGRFSKILSLLLKDKNLRASARGLLYHLVRMEETSAREFASGISEWGRGLALLHAYRHSPQEVSDESLVELYPALAARVAEESGRLQKRPTITLLATAFDARRQTLERTLLSIRQQFYANLELYLLTDSASESLVTEAAAEILGDGPKVKVVAGGAERSLASALNEAVGECRGEFLGFISGGARLTRNALFEVAKLLNARPDADLVYTDEEQRSGSDYFRRPLPKPGWSPDLFLSTNYLQNFLCCRKELVVAAGGFRGSFEGDIRYDLLLRVTELTQRIQHIPQVLYQEHLPAESSAARPNACRSRELQRRALEEHLRRTGVAARVREGICEASFRVRREIAGDPKVSIIIPTRDRVSLLRRCVESIEKKSTYRNYEIVVVDNASADAETLAYLESLPHRVLRYPGPFNFSAINNAAARAAEGSHLLFLNNDTEVIAPEWLEAMLEHSQRPEVGAVGAKLLYPDGTIQHAGIGLEPRGMVHHLNRFRAPWDHGPRGLADVVRNLNAVTGACLMTKAALFREVGGFEESLAVTHNDIDLCLKLRARGCLNVYTPFALLYHHEGVSQKVSEVVELEGAESGRPKVYKVMVPVGHADAVRLFHARWRDFIENDEYYVAEELL